MTIAHDFTAAYLHGAPLSPQPQMVPARLAAAAAEVTGIDGVGLGVVRYSWAAGTDRRQFRRSSAGRAAGIHGRAGSLRRRPPAGPDRRGH